MSTDRADGADALPTEAWIAALLALPGMGPARYRLAVDAHTGDPKKAWSMLVGPGDRPAIAGVSVATVDAWRAAARAGDVATTWRRLRDTDIGVAAVGSAACPALFDDDPEPPAALFHRGDLSALDGARVAIVGTRRCSRYGREVAFEFGAGLAEAGVSVVSGLAAGIDAASHWGSLSAAGAPPVAVVATGLDIVYPRANAELFQRVVGEGVALSEAPLGTRPERWRFPARNRLIAALADVVVVVESHRRGGSLHTVAEAAVRDRPVLAVPGPVRSPASSGTNQLLSEGCAPACSVDDVLVALGMTSGVRRPSVERRSPPSERAAVVLAAVGWQPTTFQQLAERVDLPLGDVSVAVEELVAGAWIDRRGGWFERIAADRLPSASRP